MMERIDRSDSFERQMAPVRTSLYATALRLTRSPEEAEDLAQAASLRAYLAYDRFDGANFKAWVTRIVTNLFINEWRKSRRAPSVGSLDDGADDPLSPSPLPDRVLFDQTIDGEILRALASVPEDFRIAVVLVDLDELSYDEAAVRIGVPVGTVRSRLSRGRAVMRVSLSDFAAREGYL
jgi:RNA polymerase sigma-70 factor (ECF subfamily)